MTHHFRFFLALLAGACLTLLAVIWAPAQAQTQPSKCGVWATGKLVDGEVWSGVRSRNFVDRSGWWRVCQPWVPDGGDPEMPEPKDVPCLGRDTYESWADGEAECSSLPPGAFTGVARLRYTKDGAVQLLRDEWGHHQGLIVYRCVRGKWKVEGSICQVK